MNPRSLVALLLTVGWSLAAAAQDAKLPVVEYLHSRGFADAEAQTVAFREGLEQMGFVDGRNVRIEFRWVNGKFADLPALARELVDLPVAVLAAPGCEPVALAAKAQTSTIPIVFSLSGDPVALGLAESFNRPGANVTGVNILTTTLDPKRLGLLHELVPDAATVGFLVNTNFPPLKDQIRDVTQAAGSIGIAVRVFGVNNPQEIDAAFKTIEEEGLRALAVAGSPFFDTRRNQIVGNAARIGIPAIYHFREYVEAGGLMSYGIDINDVHRQLSRYAGRILAGEKVGDLPITQPTKFDFVVNLKTAKALGIDLPPSVISIADDVIE